MCLPSIINFKISIRLVNQIINVSFLSNAHHSACDKYKLLLEEEEWKFGFNKSIEFRMRSVYILWLQQITSSFWIMFEGEDVYLRG